MTSTRWDSNKLQDLNKDSYMHHFSYLSSFVGQVGEMRGRDGQHVQFLFHARPMADIIIQS